MIIDTELKLFLNSLNDTAENSTGPIFGMNSSSSSFMEAYSDELALINDTSVQDSEYGGYDDKDMAVNTSRADGIMIEEVIMYVLILFLLVFFLTLLVRCVRITLDPYNSVARSTWFETLGNSRGDAL